MPEPWFRVWRRERCCSSTAITTRYVLTGRGAVNMYAVRDETRCAIRYVAISPGRIILRPHNPDWPVELVEIPDGKGFAEYIVGRVCHIALDV